MKQKEDIPKTAKLKEEVKVREKSDESLFEERQKAINNIKKFFEENPISDDEDNN